MGQRQLIIGDRQTGKTTVALDAILNQRGKGVVCIYCMIGKPYSSLVRVLDMLREHNALEYTIIVTGVASLSTAEQYLAPYTACMLGAYFMYSGKDVFVVFDDLTKHAWIYRQLSLINRFRYCVENRLIQVIFFIYIHSLWKEQVCLIRSEAAAL